ncbi:MAG: hypothetical protein HY914_01225 [Desulfomonile tiedjei]|nr:hypothetical protein [Desulfomonile tiedjei]
MKLRNHSVAALPLMAGTYLATSSLAATLVAGASSVLIDVDHIPDYVYFRRGWRGLSDFFATCYQSRLRKTFVCFHAWEWAIATWTVLLFWSGPTWLWAVGAGITYHLLLDQLGNDVTHSFYWISCRARHGFEFSLFAASAAEQRDARWGSAAYRAVEIPARENAFFAANRTATLGRQCSVSQVPCRSWNPRSGPFSGVAILPVLLPQDCYPSWDLPEPLPRLGCSGQKELDRG